MSVSDDSETSTKSSRNPPAETDRERVDRLLAEVRRLRLARWDAEYPVGHADREAKRLRT